MIEGARQAARMVRYVVLESGLGVRWEPSEAWIRRLEVALDRPWKELKPLSAPFARADTPIVTTEGLAWTILAEIAYARHLQAQDSPEALVYLYLASRQVGFAQEELLDRSTGLYRPAWRDGSSYGDPELDDQLWMLWALSVYSAAGALLPSPSDSDIAHSEELFREQTGPLADRLFRAVERFLRETPPALHAMPLVPRVLGAAALHAYEQAEPSRAPEAERLRKALIPEGSAISEAFQRANAPLGERLRLAEGAERVLLLWAREGLGLRDPSSPAGGKEGLSRWLSEPAVQRLLAPIPWPTQVVYNPGRGEWEIPAQEAQDVVPIEAAMALAYGLLSLTPPGALRGESEEEGPLPPRGDPSDRRRTLAGLARGLQGMNGQLRLLEERLRETQRTVDLGPPAGTWGPSLLSEAREREGSWSPWDALLVGGVLLLSLGVVLGAWGRRSRG